MEALDTGATAWMLTSASLVLLMTPALAFFYGGMSRTKSVLNMMMMSIGTMAVIGVIYPLWLLMSYGASSVGGIFANPFDGFNLSGLIYGDGGEFLLDGLWGTSDCGRCLPGHVCHHHCCAYLGCHRRSYEVPCRGLCLFCAGLRSHTSPWPTWWEEACSRDRKTGWRHVFSALLTGRPPWPPSISRAAPLYTSTLAWPHLSLR